MSAPHPSRLGPYEIVGFVGAGGMGEVYRARDRRLSREVAVKVLPKDVLRDSDGFARFVEEARAASALNHPGIVTIHDFGEEDGQPYIVMELVEGESLRQRLVHGPLSSQGDRGPGRADRRGARGGPREAGSSTATSSPRTSSSPPRGARRSSTSASRGAPRRAASRPGDTVATRMKETARGPRRRDRRLHVAGAGPRRRRGRPVRHLRARHRPLRAPLGTPPLLPGDARRHDGRGPDGRPARPLGERPSGRTRTRAARAAMPREDPGAEVPVGARRRVRPRGGRGGERLPDDRGRTARRSARAEGAGSPSSRAPSRAPSRWPRSFSARAGGRAARELRPGLPR